MAMSAQHRQKFAAFHRQWWRLHMSAKILELDEKPQTDKQKKPQKQTVRKQQGLKYE